MKRILSYGGGVNSTAILALIKLGRFEMPNEIIFCDTGAERPETYCYMEYIKKLFPITIIRNDKYKSLVDYCEKHKTIPMRQFKWCTDKFKIRPKTKYLKGQEYKSILGIDYGEQHRAKDYECEYPLIDMSIDRKECIEIIKKADMEVPIKSGCFICPQMRIGELHDMRRRYKEQFDILVSIEKTANDRQNTIFFKGDKLIPVYCNDRQIEFIEPTEAIDPSQHCMCSYD